MKTLDKVLGTLVDSGSIEKSVADRVRTFVKAEDSADAERGYLALAYEESCWCVVTRGVGNGL